MKRIMLTALAIASFVVVIGCGNSEKMPTDTTGTTGTTDATIPAPQNNSTGTTG